MDEDDQFRLRLRYTCIGLYKLTVGGSIMAYGIRNRHISHWAFPQFAFGGAMVASGLIHLSLAWDMDPPPPPRNPPNVLAPPNGLALPNGLAPRAGIPLAENERGDPDLAGEGLILHQNLPLTADVGEANLHDVGEARPSNFVAGVGRAGSGGLLRRRHIQQKHEDQDIGDNNEFGPCKAVAEVGQAKALEEVGQADDVEESDQDDNEGELGQDTDESESANVVNESGLARNVGEVEPTNEVNIAGQASNIGEVNMADSLESIAECADKDDVTDEGEPEIELPRSTVALSLDIPSIKFIDSGESDCESSY